MGEPEQLAFRNVSMLAPMYEELLSPSHLIWYDVSPFVSQSMVDAKKLNAVPWDDE